MLTWNPQSALQKLRKLAASCSFLIFLATYRRQRAPVEVEELKSPYRRFVKLLSRRVGQNSKGKQITRLNDEI